MGGWVPAVKASVPGAEREEKGRTWAVGIQAGISLPVATGTWASQAAGTGDRSIGSVHGLLFCL